MSEAPREAFAPSLAAPFAVSVALLLAALALAVLDEAVRRRPWKAYQAEFAAREARRLETRLSDEERALAARRASPEYASLVRESVSAESAVDPRAEKESRRGLEEGEEKVSGTLSDFRLLRGRLLEAEDAALRKGDPEEARRAEGLRPDVEAARRRWQDALETRDAARARLAALTGGRDALRARLAREEDGVHRVRNLLEAARGHPAAVQQIHVPDLGVTDRCVSCHIGIDRAACREEDPPFGSHPGEILARHPPERFGCTPCHGGQGPALASVAAAHGEVPFWATPLRRGHRVQSSCLLCHEEVEGLRGADVVARGARLFRRLGCAGCHRAPGVEEEPKIGPPLGGLASRVEPAWLLAWLADPSALRRNTAMPNFLLAEEQRLDLAAYLLSLPGPAPARAEFDPVLWKPDEQLVPEEAERIDRLYEGGRALWGQGRCSICHSRAGAGGEAGLGPDLAGIGLKTGREFLLAWLLDPRRLRPDSRMPRYRLPEEDARALVEFLLRDPDFEGPVTALPPVPPLAPERAERGRELARSLGCAGCHEIPGLSSAEKVGPDLEGFAEKSPVLLDWGRVHAEGGREGWALRKLADPRGFRDGLRMPLYRLEADDRKALVTLLLSFGRLRAPARARVPRPPRFVPQGGFGELARDVRCLECHRVQGTGGSFAPDLSWEGSKVERRWAAAFLQRPDVIRPMLSQMPRFGLSPEEVALATEYLASALRNDRFERPVPRGSPGEGRVLYAALGCGACHQIGSDGGAVGPNLTTVGARLRPAYLAAHLRDPATAVPGSAEPRYPLGEEEVADLVAFLSELRREGGR